MKTILITGGTGSLGTSLTKRLLLTTDSKVVVFSRDECKQFNMKNALASKGFDVGRVKFVVGDVRDLARVTKALKGCDGVIHCAAMKHVSASEENPTEAILTNVIGSQNVAQACLDTPSVDSVVALSTDKACSPVNLYGATKLCADKLFLNANMQDSDKRFSVVRYGNVMCSRGSVVPLFDSMVKEGREVLPVTNVSMTRFNITLKQAVDMVIYALNSAYGGELFVPKIPSYRILDLVAAFGKGYEEIGMFYGEKMHEEMISPSDTPYLLEGDRGYIVASKRMGESIEETKSAMKAVHGYVDSEGVHYSSESNDNFLSVDELKELIKEQLTHA